MKKYQALWQELKKSAVEEEYVVEETNASCKLYKISKNEQENGGTVNLPLLLTHMKSFQHKSFFLLHTHIQDNPLPSGTDVLHAKFMLALFQLSNVMPSDYVILSKKGHFSFKENQLWSGKPLDFVASDMEELPLSSFLTANSKWDANSVYAKEIASRLQDHNEIIVTHEKVYGSSTYFSVCDLCKIASLQKKQPVLLFTNEKKSEKYSSRLEKIMDLLHVLDVCFAGEEWESFRAGKETNNILI